jgi:nucleotide-binding universal stress UspA family protein
MSFEAKAATTGERGHPREPVVVGVDGSERNRCAVAWAAHEATARGCPLVLVHATAGHLVPTTPRLPARSREEQVLDMLADVRNEVRHIVAEETVSIVAASGDPVEVLLDQVAETGAGLLVVGKRGLGGFARVIVGSTSIALAGRSPVPVAIVPDVWEQSRHEGHPVVLGIDPDKSDHQPIEAAFRRARRLGVALVAVHGWEAPANYSWDPAAVTGEITEREQHAAARFDGLLAEWSERHPDVVVRPMRSHKHPAAAVLEAAEESQVVVLGRHPAGAFGGFAFGSVARAVLHYAECPVITVPSDE